MQDAEQDRRPRKRVRKRRQRFPKGFNPDNPGPPPDPERWLPKHERSAFKKRRKGRSKHQPASKGAQVLS
jgi:signal recognition particle subunit SRP72